MQVPIFGQPKNEVRRFFSEFDETRTEESIAAAAAYAQSEDGNRNNHEEECRNNGRAVHDRLKGNGLPFHAPEPLRLKFVFVFNDQRHRPQSFRHSHHRKHAEEVKSFFVTFTVSNARLFVRFRNTNFRSVAGPEKPPEQIKGIEIEPAQHVPRSPSRCFDLDEIVGDVAFTINILY